MASTEPPLVARVRVLAESCPDGVAVEDANWQATSWRDLWNSAERIAFRLHDALLAHAELDFELRQPVAILLQRSAQWLATTLAVLQVGSPFVWLCPRELRGEVEAEHHRNLQVLAQLRPKAVIVQRMLPEELQAQAEMPIIKLEMLTLTAGPLHRARTSVAPPRGQDVMCFLFTGGTTGTPKCASIPHRLALHEIRAYPWLLSASSEDRMLQQSPCLWPAAPLGQVMIAMAFGCTTLVSNVGGSPGELSEELTRRRCTMLGAVPSVLAALDPQKLRNCLRIVVSWAEALESTTARAWRAVGIQLVDLLISTEVWLSLYSFRGNNEDEHSRAMYKLLRSPEDVDVARVFVIDDDTGCELEVGEIGRLHIAGPIFDGYLGESSETCLVNWRGHRCFRSQDLVRVVPEGIVFCGRADSLMKLGGKFIDVRGIEERLQAVEGVKMASCVLDPRLTSCRRAFVVLRQIPPLAAKDVEEALRQARQALPSGFVLNVVSTLPRTGATGKVDRASLVKKSALLERLPDHSQARQCHDICRLAGRHWQMRNFLMRVLRFHPFRCACFAYLIRALCLHDDATKSSTPLRLVRRVPTLLLVACRDWPLKRLLAETAQALRFYKKAAFPRPEAFRAWPTLFWLGVPLWFEQSPWKPLKGTLIKWLENSWGEKSRSGRRGSPDRSTSEGSARKRQRAAESSQTSPYVRQQQEPAAEGLEVTTSDDTQCAGSLGQRALLTEFQAASSSAEGDCLQVMDVCTKSSQVNYEGMITYSDYNFETLEPVPEVTAGAAGFRSAIGDSTSSRSGAGTRRGRSELDLCITNAGLDMGADGCFLSAITSVKGLHLASLLRRTVGVSLDLPVLLDCKSLADVQTAVENAAVDGAAVEPLENRSASPLCRVWLWYWQHPSPWLLRFQRPGHVDWEALKIAFQCLVTRHSACRMAHESPQPHQWFANQAAAALSVAAEAGTWSKDFCRLAGESCFNAWPAMQRLTVDSGCYLNRATPVSTFEDLLDKVKSWESAFQDYECLTSFLLIPAKSLTDGEVQHDHVHIMITHAFADGSSIEPLLNDFCTMYDAAKSARCRANLADQVAEAMLPLLKDGPQEMEQRLKQSLEDPGKGSLNFAHVCNSASAWQNLASNTWAARVRLPRPWVSQAQLAAGIAQTSVEVVLLMVLSVAIARASGQSWVPLTLVVSARDGAGDSEHVSLIAEDRSLDLDLANASLVEALLAVSQGTRLRLWRMPEPLAAYDRVRINVVHMAPSDPKAAFRQVPYSYERGSVRRPWRMNSAGEIYAEELEDGGWELECKFADCKLPQSEYEIFRKAMQGVPAELLSNALAPALPDR